APRYWLVVADQHDGRARDTDAGRVVARGVDRVLEPDRLHFLLKVRTAPEHCALSLHDALPISHRPPATPRRCRVPRRRARSLSKSEEHTSELQSPYELVCRLLLEKKKSRNSCQLLARSTSSRTPRSWEGRFPDHHTDVDSPRSE